MQAHLLPGAVVLAGSLFLIDTERFSTSIIFACISSLIALKLRHAFFNFVLVLLKLANMGNTFFGRFSYFSPTTDIIRLTNTILPYLKK